MSSDDGVVPRWCDISMCTHLHANLQHPTINHAPRLSSTLHQHTKANTVQQVDSIVLRLSKCSARWFMSELRTNDRWSNDATIVCKWVNKRKSFMQSRVRCALTLNLKHLRESYARDVNDKLQLCWFYARSPYTEQHATWKLISFGHGQQTKWSLQLQQQVLHSKSIYFNTKKKSWNNFLTRDRAGHCRHRIIEALHNLQQIFHLNQWRHRLHKLTMRKFTFLFRSIGLEVLVDFFGYYINGWLWNHGILCIRGSFIISLNIVS